VLSTELQKIEVERAQQELHEYVSRIPEVRTTRHEEIALCGPATETIFQIADMKGIDLLVMGSHGRGAVAKMALGSVAEDAIRRMHCPVLVVGPRCARRFGSLKSIVLATDLPVGTWRAAQYATSLAGEAGAMLTIMHVVSKHLKETENPSATIGENTEMELRQLVPHDIELKMQVHFEVVRGNAADEIVRIACDRKAGLIVMGASEHSIAADHAPWATLSHVIRKAHCPVLAVQPHIA
jgi:nucleotide-binding universal stress UspA family protein